MFFDHVIDKQQKSSRKKSMYDISKKLDEEEILTLLRRTHRGDMKAKEKLIEACLWIPVRLSARFYQGEARADRIQDGILGLENAIERFDFEKENKFSTYAIRRVQQAITKGEIESRYIFRVPVHVIDELSIMRRIESKLFDKFNRQPHINEVIEEWSKEESTSKKTIEKRVVRISNLLSKSLDISRKNDGEVMCPHEMLSDNINVADNINKKIEIDNLLTISKKILDEREMTILKMRFGIDGPRYTLDEVADYITCRDDVKPFRKKQNITRERVRQIQDRAIEKIKEGHVADFII